MPRVNRARAKEGDKLAITPCNDIKSREFKCRAMMNIISSSRSCPGSDISTMGTGSRLFKPGEAMESPPVPQPIAPPLFASGALCLALDMCDDSQLSNRFIRNLLVRSLGCVTIVFGKGVP